MIPVKILPDIFGIGIPGMLEHEEELVDTIELVMVGIVMVEITFPFKSIIEFGLKLFVVLLVVVLEEVLLPELEDSVILVIVANDT